MQRSVEPGPEIAAALPARPARIAFIINRIAARAGGAERILVETANELAGRGSLIDILSYENKEGEPFYPLASGVTHTNLFPCPVTPEEKRRFRRKERLRKMTPRIFPLSIGKWGLWNFGFIAAVKSYIETSGVDVLVPFMPPAMVATALASRGTGVPVVGSTHNAPEQDFENPERWDPNHVDVWLRRRTLDLMTSILVLLPDYADWYPAKLHPKIRVIANPIQPLPEALLASRERRKVVISVGRLASVKRHDLLIEVWSDLVRDFPDWRLHIFGDGPRRLSLEKLIEEKGLGDAVKLMGTTAEIESEYLSSAILCHPAAYEGFPLVVGEALAAGLPVVGFADCSGLNHLVKDGVNGILVPAKDRRPALTEALSRLMADEGLRRRLAGAAPATVAAYAPARIYDQWDAVICEAMLSNARAAKADGTSDPRRSRVGSASPTDRHVAG